MTDNGHGQVVTFYSYKGGTGRTMALANVAWILASNGKRVLVVDWDLESPGLHRFYAPFIDPDTLASRGGVIDLIREYEWATTSRQEPGDRWHERHAKVDTHSFSLNWQFPGGGRLDFLSAGRQNHDYASALSGLNWDDFYDRLGGGLFFDALRADMKRRYDYTLIDSRTGLSDVADICTIHMPDVLVDCFTLSDQGIDGAAQVARAIRDRYRSRNIRILPVPMRVDPAEKQRAEAGLEVARQRFAGLPADLTDDERTSYWFTVQVPYRAFYAYEETLATFGDPPSSPTSLLAAYENLTKLVTNGEVTRLPAMDESTRRRISARFVRLPTIVEAEVTLRYAATDQVWAEWIEQVLVSAHVRVNDPWTSGEVGGSPAARQLSIISQVSPADLVVVPRDRDSRTPLAVYVADTSTMLPLVPIADSAFLTGVSDTVATERVLRLAGRSDALNDVLAAGYRFPGTEPIVFNVPPRNARFTGREADLRALRARLKSARTTVVLQGTLPVALHGMGGIGKTQVAMEYAYRFRSAYDVVWWIDADVPSEIDNSLVDLGRRLGIAVQPSVPEAARAVLQVLGRGEPYQRWLLIFDNADEPERVSQLLPQGRGHVLITSRDPSWTDRAQSVQLDVFERSESVAHLTQRVATLTPEEANRIAETLGDLPIAVAAAGAWLADTGSSAEDYLHQIDLHGPKAIDSGPDRSVEATWDLSLERLQERSKGAYRLLQLCSVLGPEIAADLIYSDAMAEALVPVDREVTERMARGKLVQQISRLALLRVDQRGERRPGGDRSEDRQGGQIVVHRVLQHVVRSRMNSEELIDARHQVHLVLAASRPQQEVDNPDTWPDYRVLWPHLEASGAVRCDNEAVRQLLIDRVRYDWLRVDLPRGRELAERIYRAWMELLAKKTDPAEADALRRQILHLRFNQANIVRDLGLFEESRQINEDVLAEQLRLLGEHHPHTLLTAGGLAADLRGLGRYREALARDQQTYAAWSESFGEDHPRTLTALSNLAVSYRLMGDINEARQRDEIAYQRRRLVMRADHPNVLASATNLGRDLREAGEYERSVALLRSVRDTYVQVLGPNSREAINADANLAVSLRSAGRARDAAALLDGAYDRLNDLLGPASPDTLACRLSRSVNLLELDENARAEEELTAVREAYDRNLGPAHPHTLVCMSNLAAVARAMRDPATARKLAQAAKEDLGRVLGEDHPYSLAAQMNLAICASDVDDYPVALEQMQDAAERLAVVLGPDHPHTMRCQANRALIVRQMGRPGPDADATVIIDRLADRIGSTHSAVVALRQGHLVRRIIDPHPL